MAEINRFNFWCPVEIQKSELDPITGKPKKMKLGGIASTADEDTDGEFLDPTGFDITPLVERGVVNWHHQAKGDPSAIIGEPTNVKIKKEGLYLEADLYPDSKMANDVYYLAQTLESNSSTRRLGFSIEGKVLERGSKDVNNPEYKHIKKALITGVAITHMPKNPKTFANIIKGDIDDIVEDIDDIVEDNNANDVMVKNFTKGEVYDKIFNDIPGISIEKAISIENLITNISKMEKKKFITEDDIQKAYDALGIEKSDNYETDETETEKTETETEKTETETEKTETEDEKKRNSNDDDIEEGCGGKVSKADFSSIKKAIVTSHAINEKYLKALGSIVKDNNAKFEKLSELIKSQEDTINALCETIEEFGSETPAPKSVSHVRPIERTFSKGVNDEMNEEDKPNVLSIFRDKRKIVNILDQATFAKGYDEQFSKACTQFESSGILPSEVAKRLQNEFGIEIVK